MQAVIHTGGKQYTVAEGDEILVELLDSDIGGEVTFDDVRLTTGEGDTKIGAPRVDGAVVKGTVLNQVKGPKVRSVKFRRRKDSRTVKGHRQKFHRVRITGIQA